MNEIIKLFESPDTNAFLKRVCENGRLSITNEEDNLKYMEIVNQVKEYHRQKYNRSKMN